VKPFPLSLGIVYAIFEPVTKRAKKIVGVCLSLPLFFVLWILFVWVFNPFHTHEHCIKISGSTLQSYAADHEGRFPYHTNGFGDALLLHVKEDALNYGDTNTGEYTVRFITGPGDDGKVFKDALRNSTAVPEEKCSRIYIQGLTETNNPQIALLFDKKSTRGGDHFRRPWGSLLREVCMLDGSMQTIREELWAAFSKRQIDLLVEEGIDSATAEHYYRIP
jgi:hypothetical protein